MEGKRNTVRQQASARCAHSVASQPARRSGRPRSARVVHRRAGMPPPRSRRRLPTIHRTLVIGIAGGPGDARSGVRRGDSIANTIIKNTYLQWARYGVGEGAGGHHRVRRRDDPARGGVSTEMSDDEPDGDVHRDRGRHLPERQPDHRPTTSLHRPAAPSRRTPDPCSSSTPLGITDISTGREDQRHPVLRSRLPAPSFRCSARSCVTRTPRCSTPLPSRRTRPRTRPVGDQVDGAEQRAVAWAYTLVELRAGQPGGADEEPDYPGARSRTSLRSVILDHPVLGRTAPSSSQTARSTSPSPSASRRRPASKGHRGRHGAQRADTSPRTSSAWCGPSKPFADARVRQAIAHAIDYDSIANDRSAARPRSRRASGRRTRPSFDASCIRTTRYDRPRWRGRCSRRRATATGSTFTVEVSTADADGQALAVAAQRRLLRRSA